MSSNMYKILYCSRNLIVEEGSQRDAEIHQILETARVNNRRQDVTGALLFNSGCFAQMLEGPRASIERIFEKIQRDPRHGQVTVLENGETTEREFPDWSMAHVQPGPDAECAEVAVALDEALKNPSASGSAVLDLLRTLVIQAD